MEALAEVGCKMPLLVSALLMRTGLAAKAGKGASKARPVRKLQRAARSGKR